MVPLCFLDGHTRRIVRCSLVRHINQNMTHISEYHLGVPSTTSTICVNSCRNPTSELRQDSSSDTPLPSRLWIYLKTASAAAPTVTHLSFHRFFLIASMCRFPGFNIILNFPASSRRSISSRQTSAHSRLAVTKKTCVRWVWIRRQRSSCARLVSCRKTSHHMTETSNLILLK